ncbi:MAG: TetR/AcrR family transcriptional regulator [Methyloligellaceae bacterium]
MDTKEKILITATELFLGKGYGVVGTSEICKNAGVNKGTFYHYFPSKSALLIATIERYAEEFRMAFVNISASRDNPEDKITALFSVPADANIRWKKKNGISQGCLVGNMTLELGTVDETVRQSVKDALRTWQHAIEPIIVELINNGDIPAIQPSAGAELVVAMIQGGLVLAKSENDPGRLTSISLATVGALSSLKQDTC